MDNGEKISIFKKHKKDEEGNIILVEKDFGVEVLELLVNEGDFLLDFLLLFRLRADILRECRAE